MPEGFDTSNASPPNISPEVQERMLKRLTEQVMEGQPTGVERTACPFTAEQLEFLTMTFQDMMVTMGNPALVLVGYNPVSDTYVKWMNGGRLKQ
jgi:hypothetical protein